VRLQITYTHPQGVLSPILW